MGGVRFNSPSLLSNEHDLGHFDSGKETLDRWLLTKALKNQKSQASRTFVICVADKIVIGYYCFCVGSVARNRTAKSLTRNMPNEIPVILVGRLAIDLKYQKRGLGAALLRDATIRSFAVQEKVAVKALVVEAIDEKAAEYYESKGFIASPPPQEKLTLFLALNESTRNALIERGPNRNI